MGKTPSSHIIHSLGGEYCWIVRDSEPIRLLKSPRSLSVYILMQDIHWLSSQSDRAKNTIHCFSMYLMKIFLLYMRNISFIFIIMNIWKSYMRTAEWRIKWKMIIAVITQLLQLRKESLNLLFTPQFTQYYMTFIHS